MNDERIPPVAWLGAAMFVAALYVVFVVLADLGF